MIKKDNKEGSLNSLTKKEEEQDNNTNNTNNNTNNNTKKEDDNQHWSTQSYFDEQEQIRDLFIIPSIETILTMQE